MTQLQKNFGEGKEEPRSARPLSDALRESFEVAKSKQGVGRERMDANYFLIRFQARLKILLDGLDPVISQPVEIKIHEMLGDLARRHTDAIQSGKFVDTMNEDVLHIAKYIQNIAILQQNDEILNRLKTKQSEQVTDEARGGLMRTLEAQ